MFYVIFKIFYIILSHFRTRGLQTIRTAEPSEQVAPIATLPTKDPHPLRCVHHSGVQQAGVWAIAIGRWTDPRWWTCLDEQRVGTRRVCRVPVSSFPIRFEANHMKKELENSRSVSS